MKVLMISLDTLRADRLGCLGYPKSLTPNIDRLAAEGALFEQACATDIPTQPSHTALFTGKFGISTGVVAHCFPGTVLDPNEAWLPSIFRSTGHTTGAVDHLFAMKEWFVRGYCDYMVPPGRSRAPANVVNDFAICWLADHVDEDFFLFLHYWDAHIPYTPPESYKTRHTERSAFLRDPLIEQRLRSRPTYPLFAYNLYRHLDDAPNLGYIADLYDAEIEYLDAEIGRLICHLEDLAILDDTLVVVFGDHGENMTEHDAWFDHAGLYDSIVHVPLIMRGPGVSACRIEPQVGLVDVFPTVLELAGLPEVAGRDGRSLLPLIRGEEAVGRPTLFLSECTWQAKRGIRAPGWKFIRTDHPGVYPRDGVELYDLLRDPQEQHNVATEHPDVVVSMSGMLDAWLDHKLAGRPDPFDVVIGAGLPAVARLDGTIVPPSPSPPLPGEPGGPVPPEGCRLAEPVLFSSLDSSSLPVSLRSRSRLVLAGIQPSVPPDIGSGPGVVGIRRRAGTRGEQERKVPQ